MSALLKNLWKFFKSKASLCVSKLSTPKPPSDFGKQTIYHAALGDDLALISTPLQR
jgi:hypothetical protein